MTRADRTDRFRCEGCKHHWQLGGACKKHLLHDAELRRVQYQCTDYEKRENKR